MLRNKNKYFSTELFVVTDFLIRKMSTMPLDLKGKIALVTGGASGIGLACVKALLRNGVKAVTLADINTNSVEIVLADIEKEFGADRVLFVKTDVTNSQQFENAFKKTIEKFKQLDILVNNAGIYNEQEWEKEVAINVNGVINGVLLGLENYLPKNRQGPEAVIVNLASIAAIDRFPNGPIYCATKAAVATLTRNFGDISYYERTKVRLLAVCPGVTMTPLVVDPALARKLYPVQEPEHVAEETVKLIRSSPNGTLWIVEGGKPAYQYIFAEKDATNKL